MSETTKYTPGPWEIQRDISDRFRIVGPRGGFVANCDLGNANARLISAAPETTEQLLVMAKLHHQNFHGKPETFLACPRHPCCVNRAALQKAGLL